MKSEVRQRAHDVHVRLDDDEQERYAAFAARKGWSVPKLMRLAVEAALMQEQVRGYATAQDQPDSKGCSRPGGDRG